MIVLNTYVHRGRIQSQGGGINDSEAWHEPVPLPLKRGIAMAGALEARLSRTELQLRTGAFQKARRFMSNASQNGGVGPTFKTFMVPKDPSRRVDIEVRSGLAFV